jgi:hypothetical protein
VDEECCESDENRKWCKVALVTSYFFVILVRVTLGQIASFDLAGISAKWFSPRFRGNRRVQAAEVVVDSLIRRLQFRRFIVTPQFSESPQLAGGGFETQIS